MVCFTEDWVSCVVLFFLFLFVFYVVWESVCASESARVCVCARESVCVWACVCVCVRLYVCVCVCPLEGERTDGHQINTGGELRIKLSHHPFLFSIFSVIIGFIVPQVEQTSPLFSSPSLKGSSALE